MNSECLDHSGAAGCHCPAKSATDLKNLESSHVESINFCLATAKKVGHLGVQLKLDACMEVRFFLDGLPGPPVGVCKVLAVARGLGKGFGCHVIEK